MPVWSLSSISMSAGLHHICILYVYQYLVYGWGSQCFLNVSAFLWDAASSFFRFYFPLVSAHMGWCACLPGVLLSSIAYLLLFSFILDAVSACLGFLLSRSFLLSSSVSSCFLVFPLVRRVTMGRTLLGKLYGVSGGIIASTLLIFVKVFPLPAKSGAFSHSTGCTSAPPSCKFQEPNTPGRSAKGFWEPDSWAPTRFRKSVPEPRLGSFGCVVPTSGLAFLHIVVPENIEKYRKASKPLQHAF